MEWYRVDMSVERLRDGRFHRLCREFQRAFMANGAPSEMALFAQAEPSDGTRRIYFTPGSVAYVMPLIQSYGGERCDPPEEPSLTLMFGVPGAAHVVYVDSGDGVATEGIPVPARLATVHEFTGETTDASNGGVSG